MEGGRGGNLKAIRSVHQFIKHPQKLDERFKVRRGNTKCPFPPFLKKPALNQFQFLLVWMCVCVCFWVCVCVGGCGCVRVLTQKLGFWSFRFEQKSSDFFQDQHKRRKSKSFCRFKKTYFFRLKKKEVRADE